MSFLSITGSKKKLVAVVVVVVVVGSSAYLGFLHSNTIAKPWRHTRKPVTKYTPKAMVVSKFGVIGSKNHRQYCHMLTFPNGSDGFLEKRRHE